MAALIGSGGAGRKVATLSIEATKTLRWNRNDSQLYSLTFRNSSEKSIGIDFHIFEVVGKRG